MRPDLGQIKTIVVVMMENRSFDHLLGSLSLPPFNRADVDGLKNDPAWNTTVASIFNNARFPPWHCTDPFTADPGDPPHERPAIAVQLGEKRGDTQRMDGFV